MVDGFKIKKAGIDETPYFIELMNRQYNLKKTPEYYQWMFINSYLTTELFCIYYSEKPVAFYGSQIYILSNGMKCSQSVDIIIDENFRNKGLFQLLEFEVKKFAADNGCTAMSVLPNYSGMRAHIKLNGWENICKIDTMIYDCKKDFKANNDNLKEAEETGKELIYYYHDDKYINWRYDLNPVYKYRKVQLSENSFTIVKIFNDKTNNTIYGDIVDIICDPTNIKVISDLYTLTIQTLKKDNVDLITCWALPHEPQFRILNTIGFYVESRERYFCLNVLDKKYDHLYNINNWHLVQSNCEIF